MLLRGRLSRLFLLFLAIGAVIRDDDLRDERVTYNVFVREVEELDAVDTGEDVARLAQSRLLAQRKVDLRNASGHHGLRAEAEAGEKHLHLLRSGVLRFVE